jgi:hypothetical protein
MNARHFKLLAMLLGSLFVAACNTVPVAPRAFNCEVSTELLNRKCATPKPISNDATYAELVDTMEADRKALLECGITADTLRNAIKRCNRAANEYNKKIETQNKSK